MDVVSKSTGDSYAAAELNQSTNELENTLSSTGQTPAAGDLFQVAKAIADYAAHGDFYTDSGAASAYVLTVIAPKQATTAYSDGFRVRFEVGNTNTGASTVNISTLGLKDIKRQDGSALSEGDMVTGDKVTLQYDGTNFLLMKEVLQTPSVRDISRGLVIINTVANPTFQMDIDADEVLLQDSTGVPFRAASVNATVDITASGAGGLDTGSEASSTWYHLWTIAQADGTQSAILSLSATAPTMPSGYIFKALVGAIYNDSGSDFIVLRQDGSVAQIEETTALSAGGATSPTLVDITAIVPLTAKRIMGSMSALDASSLATSLATIQDSDGLNKLVTRAQVLSITNFSPFEGSADLYYFVGQATTDMGIEISGWKY